MSELFTCVYSSGYAHISHSSVFSHYSLKLVRLIHCNNIAVRYFNRLSDRGLVFRLEAWGQPCWFPGSEKLGTSRNGRMERNFPVIPILRNFGPTSRGTPKISEWNSRKRLFHSLPNPEFLEFLVEWKAPEKKGATWNRHSSHIVLTPINRLRGVDGSWFRQKLRILVFIKTAPVAKLLPWQWHWGCRCVSSVMHTYGAKFQEHCFNISRGIVYSVFYYF